MGPRVVGGLMEVGDVARVIIVGQQLVVAGEVVEPTHEPLSLVGGASDSEEQAL